MTRPAAALLVLALAGAGCASLVSQHALIGAARAPRGRSVRVWMEGAPVPADAEEIAIVTATGAARVATLAQVLETLKAEAASVGANAVVRVRYDVGASTATGVAVWLRVPGAE